MTILRLSIAAKTMETMGKKPLIHGAFFGRDVGFEEMAVAFGFAACPIRTVSQVHSVHCVVINNPSQETQNEKADALATAIPNVVLAIKTADCAPILLWGEGKKGPVVAAVHAGWRGALGGVIERALTSMETLSAHKKTIHAAIGPCIGAKSYRVSPDFAAPFLAQDSNTQTFFAHGCFDLAGYVRFRLARAGVTFIENKNADTYADAAHYHSYRRDGAAAGRQFSAICIAT